MRTTANIPGFMVALPEMVNQLMKDEYFKPNGNLRMPNMPKVNISENDESFLIEMAVPGFSKEDFSIKSEGGKLTISAEIATEKEENTAKFALREYENVSFSRSFSLPKSKVNEDAIAASYHNGILTVAMPKLEEAKPKEPKMISVG